MKDLFIVSKFTMLDMIKKKSFIISSIIIMLFIVIAFNIPRIVKYFGGDDSNIKLLVVDENDLFEGYLNNFDATSFGFDIEVKNEALEYKDLNKLFQDKKYNEAIYVLKDNNTIGITYVVENLNYITSVPEDIINMLTKVYTNIQLGKLNLTEEELLSITPEFTYNVEQTSEEQAEGEVLIFMLLSMMLFFAIYFNAYQVSTAITTEKTSKIIETLVTSTKPRTIILGKTLGVGIVGLVQTVSFVVVGIVSKILFLEEGVVDGIINFDNFTPMLALVTLIYFILGYTFYALLYALTGSTVSKPEDVQSANTPVMMITMIGFYLAYFTMMNPTSNLNKIAGLLPISSPFCLPCRIMMGLGSPLEIVSSILILLVTSILVAFISIKIYSQAILNYGSKMTLKDLFKMFKNKNY